MEFLPDVVARRFRDVPSGSWMILADPTLSDEPCLSFKVVMAADYQDQQHLYVPVTHQLYGQPSEPHLRTFGERSIVLDLGRSLIMRFSLETDRTIFSSTIKANQYPIFVADDGNYLPFYGLPPHFPEYIFDLRSVETEYSAPEDIADRAAMITHWELWPLLGDEFQGQLGQQPLISFPPPSSGEED